jgi:hypothetical protein
MKNVKEKMKDLKDLMFTIFQQRIIEMFLI